MELEEIKDWFITDVNSYGRPKKLLTKVFKLTDWITAQQKEIEELKELKAAAEFLLTGEKNKNKVLSNWMTAQKEENTKLKEDLAIYKGVCEGKDIIIKQLEEEIRMLKQYQQIAINDKQHRKKRLNKALEEIKQLKTK